MKKARLVTMNRKLPGSGVRLSETLSSELIARLDSIRTGSRRDALETTVDFALQIIEMNNTVIDVEAGDLDALLGKIKGIL